MCGGPAGRAPRCLRCRSTGFARRATPELTLINTLPHGWPRTLAAMRPSAQDGATGFGTMSMACSAAVDIVEIEGGPRQALCGPD